MSPTLYPKDKVFVNKLIMGARLYSNFDFNNKGGELKCHRMKGIRQLKRNDIVVFNFPHHNGHINFVINNVFCKRIVAIPGDSISIENGYYKNNNYDGVLGIEEQQRILSNIPESYFSKEVLYTFPADSENNTHTIKNMQNVYVPRKGDIISITPYEVIYYRMILEWETGKTITWNKQNNKIYADGKELHMHEFSHNYYFMAGDNVVDSNDSRYWGLVPEEFIVGVVKYKTN